MATRPTKRVKKHGLCLITGATLLITGWAGDVPAQTASPQGTNARPIELVADDVIYHSQQKQVHANGNVEIVQGERVLFANSVIYNQETDTVIATGDVVLREPSGDVVFSNRVELRDGFKRGIIREMKIRLANRARLSARQAVRVNEHTTRLNTAVYTRCEACPDAPEETPIWQVKAHKVTRDEKALDVEYEDATLEFFGVPVFYTPYFSHPDPTVERRSGFLAPIFGSSTKLGMELTTPYFITVGDDADITLSPRFTSAERAVLEGEYRQQFQTGRWEISGSSTYVNERDLSNRRTGANVFRGHFSTTGDFRQNRAWSWGFNGNWTSDDTYLKRYRISGADTLESDVFLQAISDQNYFNVSSFAFRGLKVNDDPGQSPVILPNIDYEWSPNVAVGGGRVTVGAHALSLIRTQGRDTRRLSVSTNWQARATDQIGLVYEPSVSLRGDAYWVSDAQKTDINARQNDSVTGRILPTAAVKVSWPLARRAGKTSQTIEPIAQIVASPGGGNPADIPNEDSQSVEISDVNLFAINRFAGFDRVDSGSRVTYGLRAGIYGDGGGFSEFLIGQSWRINQDSPFPVGSGLEDRLSDIVGRVTIAPSEQFAYNFRFRLDPERFQIDRQEHEFTGGIDWLRASISYVELEPVLNGIAAGSTNELALRADVKFSDHWSAFAAHRRDLSKGGGGLRAEGGIAYLDECLDFSLGISRDFTNDRDIDNNLSILFRLRLIGLG